MIFTEQMTYASESSADSLLVGITVSRGLTLFHAKNLTGFLRNLSEILNAFSKVFNIQAFLSGFQAALFHGSNVIGDRLNDIFEVVD